MENLKKQRGDRMPLRRFKKRETDEFLEKHEELVIDFDQDQGLETATYELSNELPQKMIDFTVLENHQLLVQFDNGEKKVFDMTSDLRSPTFAFLKDPEQFSRAQLINNGGAISWMNPDRSVVKLSVEIIYFQSSPA